MINYREIKFYMRSGLIKSSSENSIVRPKTILENINEYKKLLTNLETFSIICFPEEKILEDTSYTTDIDSCCAFVIFNEGKQYIFGHFNSEIKG